jgi:superfamily I DNA/RNA helicase
MVLCRVNAPLIGLAYACIKANKPVKIQGRNIGEGIAKRIKKLVTTSATVPELLEAVDAWQLKEQAKLTKTFGAGTIRLENKLQQLSDEVQCIKALCEGMRSVLEVLSRVTVLFADVEKGNSSNFILLSSVHKAKGLESRVVRIINPELLPHPSAHLPWQKEQEMNLKYVAITRSLHTLHIH